MFKRLVPLVAVLALLLPCLLVPASAAYVDGNGNVAYSLDEVAASVIETDTTYEVSIDPDVMNLVHYVSGDYTDYPFYFVSLFGGGFDILYQNGRYELTPDGGGNFYVDISTFPESTSLSITVWLYDAFGNLVDDAPHSIDAYFKYTNSMVDNGYVIPYWHDDTWFDGIWTLDLPVPTTFQYANYMFLLEGDVVDATRPYVEAKIVFQKADIADNSEVLDAIDKIEQKLDDIVNMPVNPKPPVGADNVTNAGEKEDQLLNSGAAGREEFNNMLGGSAASLELYTSSFAFLSACINPIIDIPWIKEILTISLGLGLTGFILNLGISAISKAGKDGGKSSGKGGGK